MTTYTVKLTAEQIDILLGAACACEDRNHVNLQKEERNYMRDALEKANLRLIEARFVLEDAMKEKEVAP